MGRTVESLQKSNRIIMYRHFIKRLLDFMISLTAITILSPLIVTVTIWLKIANKGAGAFLLKNARDYTQKFSKSLNSRP